MNSEKKALEFDEIASNVFAPIYSVIASQIKEKTNINEGICLDLGCGGGHLGIEMEKISGMVTYLLDISPYALKIADNRIKNSSLDNRIKTILGDAHNIPFEDETVDLVISRGSIWFWEDQVKVFKEIYRILTKGGCAYIGGGYGNAELKKEVFKKMEEREENWEDTRKSFVKDNSPEKFNKIAKEANIPSYEIIDDERGLWIFINKCNRREK
ncbi:class I SAM-dependent methyltransferase [Clostridium ljungdahlii]|uniref:Erythromycin 3''-O-methyltransferase n=1 Tax=Clostridium ljungdahlii TaxID=1538 RepID=A0A162N8Z2_9CLOT|nr:class I SAM-dependent methyltransferase [Clostridium ljungdahlii]OAA90379.1 Erythromycin 3''-O-methyltransferase [Clostridium ljungdahlii]